MIRPAPPALRRSSLRSQQPFALASVLSIASAELKNVWTRSTSRGPAKSKIICTMSREIFWRSTRPMVSEPWTDSNEVSHWVSSPVSEPLQCTSASPLHVKLARPELPSCHTFGNLAALIAQTYKIEVFTFERFSSIRQTTTCM